MRVAAFQFDVRRGDVGANLAAVERGLRAAVDGGIELVVLPEMWPTSFVAGGEPAEWLRST
jgi:predicted amidohydrolase